MSAATPATKAHPKVAPRRLAPLLADLEGHFCVVLAGNIDQAALYDRLKAEYPNAVTKPHAVEGLTRMDIVIEGVDLSLVFADALLPAAGAK